MSDGQPSANWFHVFPALQIPEVLDYLKGTWAMLQESYPRRVSFAHEEPKLTDNLCEALNDGDRRFEHGIPCDFQAERWELRRDAEGNVTRIARTDITVVLGVPGTPRLVIEFKKLDGTTHARWLYLFGGMERFVKGFYSVGHDFAVMCGLSCVDVEQEGQDMAHYVAQAQYAKRLTCIADADGRFVMVPSPTAPQAAHFDTVHERPSLKPARSIVLLHMLLPCPTPI